MKARNTQVIAAAAALFLMSGFQTVRADTVSTKTYVIAPYNNEQFYITSSDPGANIVVAALVHLGGNPHSIRKNRKSSWKTPTDSM